MVPQSTPVGWAPAVRGRQLHRRKPEKYVAHVQMLPHMTPEILGPRPSCGDGRIFLQSAIELSAQVEGSFALPPPTPTPPTPTPPPGLSSI